MRAEMSQSRTLTSMARATTPPPAMDTNTGPFISMVPEIKFPSRTTTSTKPLVVLPRSRPTLFSTLSTTTGTTTPATPSRLVRVATFSLRVMSSRTSRLLLRPLPSRANFSPLTLALLALLLLAALARPTLSAVLALSARATLIS